MRNLSARIFYGGDSRGLQVRTLDKDIQVMVALDIREKDSGRGHWKGVDLIIIQARANLSSHKIR